MDDPLKPDSQLDRLRSELQKLIPVEEGLRRETLQVNQALQACQLSVQALMEETEVATRKSIALRILIRDLQNQHDLTFKDARFISPTQQASELEKSFLRQLLILRGQEAEEHQKVKNALQNLQRGSMKTLSQLRMIEQQSDTLAKLKAKLRCLRNDELICTRKWSSLARQNQQLQARQKSLKLQLDRQASTIQQHYETYIAKVNKNNSRLAYLQSTTDERVISEHLVQQVSFQQQQRKNAEAQLNQLTSQLGLLENSLMRVRQQYSILNRIFMGSSEESRLAKRMKDRMEQLNDLILDFRHGVSQPRMIAHTRLLESSAMYLQRLQEANKYLQFHHGPSVQSHSTMEDVAAGKFLSELLAEKDTTMKAQQLKVQSLMNTLEECRRNRQKLEEETKKFERDILLTRQPFAT